MKSVIALGLMACAGLTGCVVDNPFETDKNLIVEMVKGPTIDQVYAPFLKTQAGGMLFIHHWWSGPKWCYSNPEQWQYFQELTPVAEKQVYDGKEYIKFDKLDNFFLPLKIKGVKVGQCFDAPPSMFDFDNLTIVGEVKEDKQSGVKPSSYSFKVSKKAAEQFNRMSIDQAKADAENEK